MRRKGNDIKSKTTIFFKMTKINKYLKKMAYVKQRITQAAKESTPHDRKGHQKDKTT